MTLSGFLLRPFSEKPVLHNTRSRRFKKTTTPQYLWRLVKNVRKSTQQEVKHYFESFEEFRPAPQEIINLEDIGNGLTADFVIQILTVNNPFYYEYTPEEGDCLHLKEEGGRHPLVIIYLQKEWTFFHFHEMRFGDEIFVDEGFVEFIYQTDSSSLSE